MDFGWYQIVKRFNSKSFESLIINSKSFEIIAPSHLLENKIILISSNIKQKLLLLIEGLQEHVNDAGKRIIIKSGIGIEFFRIWHDSQM